jgi:PAP2 superfamily
MRADRPLVAVNTTPNMNATFPVHYWDSDLFALTFLPEFFTANVGGQTWDQAITVGAPPAIIPIGPGGAPGDDRIDELRVLAVTERPEAMGEILNQHQNQQLCFMQLLMIIDNSHPATFFVMKLGARVGEVVMMHLKRHWNRPRPSQICPTLYPPVPVLGHAAYPAGHALIAHLTAKVLIEVTERPGPPPSSPYEEALTELAREIGLNRVIAGLHFRSDITAGEEAAEKTHNFLKGMPDPFVPPNPQPAPPNFNYGTAIRAAKKEWI